jgi:cell division protein FtsZ
MPGLINLDFADVRTTMLDGGAAIMGSASATGEDRAEIAAREAINSPLLDGVSIRGARNVLVNISSGTNLGMRETTTATSIIQQESGEEAEIILGTVLDESYEDELRVTVIATGFDLEDGNSDAKIAPNSSQNSVKSARQKFKIPKADNFVGQSRYSATGGAFYKGEKNLKNMDSPAINRRSWGKVTPMNEKDEKAQADEEKQDKKQKKGDKLLNDRRERIDKSDTNQPAFLRKIMD